MLRQATKLQSKDERTGTTALELTTSAHSNESENKDSINSAADDGYTVVRRRKCWDAIATQQQDGTPSAGAAKKNAAKPQNTEYALKPPNNAGDRRGKDLNGDKNKPKRKAKEKKAKLPKSSRATLICNYRTRDCARAQTRHY
ncbi:hypothetical protein CCR75_006956 [Bremia lactucae]|uniref:Uncharacterized protein n=1 Tax=Bremia lactucae TaxID=4779 RepID=A0A976IK42_BRELC|nr:hypothetical protein CCR75_006956 [Bremia lactucae]